MLDLGRSMSILVFMLTYSVVWNIMSVSIKFHNGLHEPTQRLPCCTPLALAWEQVPRTTAEVFRCNNWCRIVRKSCRRRSQSRKCPTRQWQCSWLCERESEWVLLRWVPNFPTQSLPLSYSLILGPLAFSQSCMEALHWRASVFIVS